ncbi:GAF domain-containing sensor histidine kinase [Chryseobacterium indoltheticum]|uniref:histidine kinase n=1 Tax=Chryseobacterium indoltheticum TaxID=254 RepID=A0A381FQ41_9FLAO|nr:GAF domain-containing sensor histidine kinase [Chryseobacterium indoltheticum]SUX48706.1 Bacteriophytochrome [Chryseobacterium indoltheticum]
MESNTIESKFEKNIKDINQIPAVANILEVICNTTGMGYAVIARVTEDRWIACAVNDKINFGLGVGGELKVETTLCHQVQQFQETVAIDDVDNDPLYSDHHTPKTYGLKSYISIPLILKNGDFFGTLCAIDPRPALVNNEKTINMFKLFAELIAFNLDSMQTLSETKNKLVGEQKNAEVREQFIAMLGHDLRNPVNAISISAQVLLRSTLEDRNMKLAKIIQDSAMRTKGLIDNILDFASGRLGGGIKLNYENSETLASTLHQVVDELEIVYPDRVILTDFNLNQEIKGDYKRIAQLFSNLLGNAITHGEKETPVIVEAKTRSNHFELCVINKGTKISSEAKKYLFVPFSRGKVHQGQEGLGLGLFIANEIAKAHDGKLSLESTDEQTCFTFEFLY